MLESKEEKGEDSKRPKSVPNFASLSGTCHGNMPPQVKRDSKFNGMNETLQEEKQDWVFVAVEL